MDTLSHIPPKATSKRTPLYVLIPVLILLLAGGIAVYLMKSKPTAQKKKPKTKPPLVELLKVKAENHPVTLSAMGTVMPSNKTELKVRVAGDVVWISPNLEPGGRIREGEPLMRLDETDLLLALDTAKAKHQQAIADLDLEEGNQRVAQNELNLMQATMGRTVKDKRLALRKPQLAKAKASVALAKIEVRKAEIELSRTIIAAPYSGLVLTRTLAKGSLAQANQGVAEITGDRVYWVEVTLPVRDLPWLNFTSSTPGNAARITTPAGSVFKGRVLRLLGDLNTATRMARLLLEVRDPMGQAKAAGVPPLLINSYVKAEIDGAPLTEVIGLPEKALKNGSEVWLAKEGKLTIAPVEIIRKEAGNVYVKSGLSQGDQVILTQLTTPVDGLVIRTGNEKPSGKGSAQSKEGAK
ncbi:efflux RND transporter periplasmic adaptor subunit [Desulfoluna sp.]|uniref:efflux RND transporter periplasmic adaptor subunit n=1 Tax=Desulfoluna sp. TaxID=2045199 RepID=UPI0026134D8B|nr:efflux RND transporter periplasmic adaptor subunit [Desulfoluna sp.]